VNVAADTLDAFGLLKVIGSIVLVDPVSWLSKVCARLFLNASLVDKVVPIPSLSVHRVEATVREEFECADVDVVLEILVTMGICFHHTSASDERALIIPAMLPPSRRGELERSLITSPGESTPLIGRQVRCARVEDSIPLVLMSELQAGLYVDPPLSVTATLV
jgi:hypothetical protein